MRSLVSHPAVQLHSVSQRYRPRQGAAWGCEGRFRRRIGGQDEVEPSGSQASRTARLEAVLFLAREPLASRKISQLANLTDGTEARTLMRRLNEQYEADGRAFRVEEIAQGYHLLTRPKFAPWLRRLTGTDTQVRFSHPALETLAVVAYRQPVLRAEIESVRGVQCGEILRQLMERGMVRIVGRADELGRPMLYGTARQFLQTFGLKHLDDLPRADQLRRDSDDEIMENGDTTSEQETSAMSLDSNTTTTVANLDDDLMEDEVYDEDIDDLDDDEDEFDDEDSDDDDGLEESEWEEVDDEDTDDEEEFDGDKDAAAGDDWDDDEDDDWDEDEKD